MTYRLRTADLEQIIEVVMYSQACLNLREEAGSGGLLVHNPGWLLQTRLTSNSQRSDYLCLQNAEIRDVLQPPRKGLFFESWQFGAGEMAQQLRVLTALPEVLSSNPSYHLVAHNHL